MSAYIFECAGPVRVCIVMEERRKIAFSLSVHERGRHTLAGWRNTDVPMGHLKQPPSEFISAAEFILYIPPLPL